MTPVPTAIEANLKPLPPYDFWYNDPPDVVTCDCLMPTGHLIEIEVPQDLSFKEIKEVKFPKIDINISANITFY